MEQSTIQADPRRAWLALSTAIGLAVIAAWLVLGGGIDRFRPREGLPAGPGDLGQPAPDFALERPAGGQIRLADYRGQVVLLNFWATWCVPCRSEMPEIEATYRAYRERGFQVLAVNVQESPADVQPFIAELGLSFPTVLDRDTAVSRLYRARALPSSFLVDRDGTVQYVRVGPLTTASLEEQLHRLGL